MLPIKQQFAYLKNIRLILIKDFKKQKLEKGQSTNTEQLRIKDNQLCIKDNQLCINNIGDIKDTKGVWFQNKSINKIDFNLKYNEKFNKKELDYRLKQSKTEKKTVLKI